MVLIFEVESLEQMKKIMGCLITDTGNVIKDYDYNIITYTAAFNIPEMW